MNTIGVEWVSDEEVSIPNYGMTSKGKKMMLPKPDAQSYVDQKKAKYIQEPSKKKGAE